MVVSVLVLQRTSVFVVLFLPFLIFTMGSWVVLRMGIPLERREVDTSLSKVSALESTSIFSLTSLLLSPRTPTLFSSLSGLLTVSPRFGRSSTQNTHNKNKIYKILFT